ncbi:tRNA (5-methylaminomethyl-2-thiouridine)(34)-methyltransferase MnmD [Polluticaenibacter yanchengensis]|uniref:tRNA (5-methylaminomethyl-2-thiouridine)(34)-methyltransferase MnmD n=1 Tax=Polluticaenibacter yanchengensis TaxID=3014562 RepID=A0ABT4UGZ6_9BACT|nr:tRNA (5-methylaminomethyl-2-thiouridine)(34)-methyltransferase MnmD [Chitinophagaceae bacterium LY-5]
MDRIIATTQDGSHTIQLVNTTNTYHSKYGALQESTHIFINNGLKYYIAQNGLKESISVLEMGLGTGLNALLTAIVAGRENWKIDYTAIEKYPLKGHEYNSLNHAQVSDEENAADIYDKIHSSGFGNSITIHDYFELVKLEMDLHLFDAGDKKFDIIYYDAFAPQFQPDLWTAEVFDKLYACTAENGCLVTYCSKGDVRRALTAAGYRVEKAPGPIGKREILRAIKEEGFSPTK